VSRNGERKNASEADTVMRIWAPILSNFKRTVLHCAFAIYSPSLATFRRKNALSDIGRVTLHATDIALTESSEFLQAEDLPKASEMAERRLFDRLDEIDIPHRRSPRLGKITGHDRCVKRVQFLFYEAAIPHQVSGTVFLVPDATQARIALIRAGFEQSTISAGALIEPQSECAIHLLEHPRSSGITRRAGSHGRTESSR